MRPPAQPFVVSLVRIGSGPVRPFFVASLHLWPGLANATLTRISPISAISI